MKNEHEANGGDGSATHGSSLDEQDKKAMMQALACPSRLVTLMRITQLASAPGSGLHIKDRKKHFKTVKVIYNVHVLV